MEKLLSIDDKIQLYILKSLLESEGIICFIKNEYPPAAGELPPISAMPELWVMDDSQYDKAMKLIHENSQPPQLSTSWKCPQCGEQLERQFTTCWHCGNNRV
ncbi:MAG: DUF2007 domain-containing protein [Proteobacteria bacterium]|nr:DUF2007 domain-containing protein [Pseudomonadota bacterium]